MIESAKILLVYRLGIGDVFRASMLPELIKKKYPSSQVHVFVRTPASAGILRANPFVDDILLFDRNQTILNRFRCIWKIASIGYDAAIICFPGGIRSNIVGLLSRAHIRIGYVRDEASHRFKRLLLTEIVEAPHLRHELLKNFELLRPLEIVPDEKDVRMCFYPTSEDLHTALTFAVDHHLREVGFVFGIAPGSSAGQEAKRWSAVRFAEVCDYIKDKYNSECLVFETWADKTCVDIMEENSKKGFVRVRDFDLTAATSIMTLCRFLISNDNGGMHMAAAVQVPVVPIFGPSDKSTAEPLGTVHRVVQARGLSCCPCWAPEQGQISCTNAIYVRCLKEIGSQEVIERAEDIITLFEHPALRNRSL